MVSVEPEWVESVDYLTFMQIPVAFGRKYPQPTPKTSSITELYARVRPFRKQ